MGKEPADYDSKALAIYVKGTQVTQALGTLANQAKAAAAK